MKKAIWLRAFTVLPFLLPVSAMAERPVVLELFTSQGCSSCPPADALLTELAKDPSVLALSMHITYWDYLGWKDPYASPEGTQRQRAYANTVGAGQVFTPQLVVDGAVSVVGSNQGEVTQAIATAKSTMSAAAKVSFSPAVSKEKLSVSLSGAAGADIWLVYFRHHADTDVKAGENGGRKLGSTNIVTSFQKIPVSTKDATSFEVVRPSEGVAIIVQEPGLGRIRGAASFFRT